MEALAVSDSSSAIDEIWIIREGICIFHEYWTDKPLDLNIQLFSAFTMAVNSFSKNTMPSEQLRNIDFQNTTLVLEPLSEYNCLFVIKFANILPEKQLELVLSIKTAISSFIDDELTQLFSVQSAIIPLNAYRLPLTRFFTNFITNLNQNEKEIRKIDLLSILQLAENLYTIINKFAPDFSQSELDSLDLDNTFNSIIFSTGLSTDLLPNLSRRELKVEFQDFISNLRSIIKNNLSTELQTNLLQFFTQNYTLIKSYDLDEPFVLSLLSVFHEKSN